MNVADICPVGALTTKDFRFKIRVWFLDDVKSVCTGCARGCNIYASRSSNKIYRYLPRRNDAVNDTWICDEGRMSYKETVENRLTSPRYRGRETGYSRALGEAAELLRRALADGGGIVGVASPQLTNEDLLVLRELLEATDAWPGRFAVPRGDSDEILIHAEKAPNAAGAREIGFSDNTGPVGPARVALVFGHELGPDRFEGVDHVILIDTHDSELAKDATVVLPARVAQEREGSFVNAGRRVQRFAPVVEPRFEAWSAGKLIGHLAAAAGISGVDASFDAKAVAKRLGERVPAFAGMDLATLPDEGRELA